MRSLYMSHNPSAAQQMPADLSSLLSLQSANPLLAQQFYPQQQVALSMQPSLFSAFNSNSLNVPAYNNLLLSQSAFNKAMEMPKMPWHGTIPNQPIEIMEEEEAPASLTTNNTSTVPTFQKDVPREQAKVQQTGIVSESSVQAPKKETCSNEHCPFKNRSGKRGKTNGSDGGLCEKCARAFEKEQYCPFCRKIYFEDQSMLHDEEEDEKDWVQCGNCKHWVHIDCEEDKIRDILEANAQDTDYYCPKCRPKQRPTIKHVIAKATALAQKKDSPVRSTGAKAQPAATKKRKPAAAPSAEEDNDSSQAQRSPKLFSFPSPDKQEKTAAVNVPVAITKRKATKKISGDRKLTQIDFILGNFGVRLQLTDDDILNDLDALRNLSIAKAETVMKAEKKRAPPQKEAQVQNPPSAKSNGGENMRTRGQARQQGRPE